MGGEQSSYSNVDSLQSQPNVTVDGLTPSRKILPADPRSPSSQITRTPIVVDKTPEVSLDPRSPTPGVIRTPLFNFFKGVYFGKSMQSPLPYQSSSTETSMNDLSVDITTDLSFIENLSLSEGNEENSVLITEALTETGDKQSSRTKSMKQVIPKQLFVSMRSPSGRSPLKVFNQATATPTRHIQQRQKKIVESNMKSCRLREQRMYNDKENVPN